MERPKHKQLPLSPKKNKLSLILFLFCFSAILGTLKLGPHLDPPRCERTAPEERTIGLPQPPSTVENEGHAAFEEFWKQPDGMGYRPCLRFSKKYITETTAIVGDRSKYLMVVVSGGLNQQRSQTIDAVVVARILRAALVVPVFKVDPIWEDESEFSDIFDVEHFKSVLEDDVRVVSSLPQTHLRVRSVEETKTPFNVTAGWIRSKYQKLIDEHYVLLLRGIDSRLSKNLPADLQRLRCKVAFHALRFTPKISKLGNELAARMRSGGPYLALHLRMEKDVWVRTGCLPGLTPEIDSIIVEERRLHPELLTARLDLSYSDRKLAGLCPLTAVEVVRLLRALGCPRSARIYWAGGEPFGGSMALEPLVTEFPFLYNKENISLPGELEPFAKRPSILAAIDYIVAESSDVFMPSHGGNFARTIQGHRAYNGHKKHITPNKREMPPFFLNTSLSEAQFNVLVKDMHNESFGQPHVRVAGRDVTAHPIPTCMCNTSYTTASST